MKNKEKRNTILILISFRFIEIYKHDCFRNIETIKLICTFYHNIIIAFKKKMNKFFSTTRFC